MSGLRTQEAILDDLYADTHRKVKEALEPFDLPDRLLDYIASEAADLAVEREADPYSERD